MGMGYSWLWDMIAEAVYDDDDDEAIRLGKLLEDYLKGRVN